MDWPKLSDGTVDWMTAFQDPKTGLISLIDQADTSDKLRACFIYVIDSLFPQDEDEDVRETYYAVLEDTFQGASGAKALGAQKTKIRMVMMRVMNDRMKVAREYVAKKAAEKSAEDGSRPSKGSSQEAAAV